MALFSEGNLEAVGIARYRCFVFLERFAIRRRRALLPMDAGHNKTDKTYTHPAAVYRGGAVVYKGNSKGRKRKKPPTPDRAGMYGDS